MKSLSFSASSEALLGLGLALVLFATGEVAAQEVKVSASISDSTIGTEEALMYTITIEGVTTGATQMPTAPEGDGLELLKSSPNTQSSVSILNGAVTQSFSYSWTYRPEREGTARLGSTTVRVGNKAYRTNEITVHVVPQSERPKRRVQSSQRRFDPFSSLFRAPSPETTPEIRRVRENDIFIRAIPNRTKVVQNEQVIIEYQLFFREGIQLRQSRLTDSWDAEGFWREELEVETRPIPEIVVENGLRYNKIILKRAAVFPTYVGNLSVDPLRIESEALLPSLSNDPFQLLFSMRNRFQPVKLVSPSIRVESSPLPDPAPDSFSGAVGTYEFSTRIDRTSILVGESIQFTVTISGAGNLATLDAPGFSPPAAFELYEPRVSLNLNRNGRMLSGTKSFTYVLVARTNGNFEIPPVEFTSYNPRSKKYVSNRSDPVTVTVTGTATTPASVVATTNGLPVDDVAAPFSQAGDWTRLNPVPYHTMAWPYAALIFPLLILGFVFGIQRYQNKLAGDITFARNRRAHPLAKKNLKKALVLMKKAETIHFFAELERAILGFIGNRLNVSERGLTRNQLDDSLRRADVPESLRTGLKELLNICDRGRFAPGEIGSGKLESAYEDASALIVALGASLDGNS